MEFRRLTIEDLDATFENRLRALADSPTAFMTTLADQKARGPANYEATLSHTGDEKAIFGAVEGGRVIGTCGIMFEDRARTRHKATIWGMFVDPSHRGKGIGAKLVDLALEFAREARVNAVVQLTVTVGNDAALKLYEAKGFEVWGTEAAAMRENGEDYDEHHLAIRL